MTLPTSRDQSLSGYAQCIQAMENGTIPSVEPNTLGPLQDKDAISAEIESLKKTAMKQQSMHNLHKSTGGNTGVHKDFQNMLHRAFVSLANIAAICRCSDAEDQLVLIEMHLLRAELALMCQNFALAHRSLQQTLSMGAVTEAYALLAKLYLQEHQRAPSKYALQIANMPKM